MNPSKSLPSDRPATNAKLALHFTHDGHKYKIFRRPPLPTARWYLHFQKSGRRYNRSLDTTLQEKALTNAKRIINAVREKRWTDLANAAAKRAYADLESIIRAYEKHPDGPKERTARNNVLAFRSILRRARHLQNLAGVSSAELTPKLIREYKTAIAAAIPPDATDVASNRTKRSANSTLRQARSLFAKKILSAYADAGLTLPDLQPFLDEPGFYKVANPDYQIADDQLIARTFRALHKLRASGHPEKLNRFKAICLALGGGLRKSEMGPAAWEWFITVDGRPFLRGDKLCKNNRGLDIPFQTQIWEWLQSVKPAGAAPADPILVVPHKTALENIFRKIGRWMRKLGWRSQKKTHEFRALLLSKIVMQHGLLAGRDIGRHATSDITENSYGRYITTKNVDVQFAQNL